MVENRTYNPSDINSISKFSNDLLEYDDHDVNEEFLKLNINKTINELKLLKKVDYDGEKTNQLLRLMANILFFCDSKSSQNIINEILNAGFHSILTNIYDFQIQKAQINFNILISLIMSLNSLSLVSVAAAKENIKYEFHRKIMDLQESIKAVDLVSEDEKWLCLYNLSRIFIGFNTIHREMKEAFIGINTVPRLSSELKKLDSIINQKDVIKFIKSDMIYNIANLLSEQQLDTLPISDEFVSMEIDRLNVMISNSKINEQLLHNTKYYWAIRINNWDLYSYADRRLKSITNIAVNDTIKRKLYEAGIIPLLEEFLKNGNEIEIENASELLCSICFNDSAAKYVKGRNDLVLIIQNLKEKSNKESTRNSCKQILEMISNTIEKRISSAKTRKSDGQHIMISYNHKYKEECLKIHENLIKKGYKTWMDVNSVFSDLHDAMADAIEKASVVLICYSYEYKTSNNCRLEAQYAFKLNKSIIPIKLQSKYEPDGWLGLVLATKLYVDFAKDGDSSSFYNNLYKQIDNFLTKKVDDIQQRPPSAKTNLPQKESQPQTLARPPSRSISSAARRSEINAKAWTKEQVKNWLIDNNMSTMVNVLAACTGTSLKALHEMKQKDYTQFCNTIEKEIEKSKADVNTFDKLNFYENLQNLFSN